MCLIYTVATAPPSVNAYIDPTHSKIDNTPFSTFDNDECPRFTPFQERSQAIIADKSHQNARKKLGFESLFDTTDPNVDEGSDFVF